MTNTETLLSELKQAGLARKAEALVALGRDGYQIRRSVVSGGQVPLAASFLGGSPDAPADFAWPTGEEGTLEFIAQINLAELPQPCALPDQGLLSFFARWTKGRVFYFPDTGALRRLPNPLPEVQRGFVGWLKRELKSGGGPHLYTACRLDIVPTFSLPDLNSRVVESLALTREEDELYDGFLQKLWPKETPRHQLLGHPELIQNDMELECEYYRRGFTWKDGNPWTHPQRAEFEAGAREWQLLLQVDSDDEAGMMWGDLGRLYFWIRREELAQRAFDKCEMVQQCT